MAIAVAIDDPCRADIAALLEASEAYGASLYPAESNHFMPLDALCAANVLFVSARDGDGTALATGALALFDGWGELKRMWVAPAARGRGISKAILGDLEARARRAGLVLLRLETGVQNTEALALYRRAGFSPCAPFADYGPDPLSVFMQKAIV